MKKVAIFATLFICMFLVASESFGSDPVMLKSLTNKPDNWYQAQINYELGFLDVLDHTIQFGTNGSVFDYVTEGSQDVLFPFSRISADVKLNKRHNLTFLIQPFDLQTRTIIERDIVIDNQIFPANTPLDLRYGFTFYRLSYLYDFWKADDRELGFGLSFQLRNATIEFSSSDGELLRSNTNVGPVPIFKFRMKYPFGNGFWIGSEVDGFYASGKYITGSRNDFEGAILDATFVTQALRRRAATIADKHNLTFVILQTDCPQEVSIRRILRRSKDNYESNALTEQAYLNNKKRFEEVDLNDLKTGL